MVNMPNVLGMRLEDALAECRAQGVEPEIVMTRRRKGVSRGRFGSSAQKKAS